MRTIRVFCAGELSARSRIPLDERAAHHVRNVLRLRTGDPLVAFNGDGMNYPATVVGLGRAVEIEIDTPSPAITESPLRITLALALIRPERFEFALQKATELGVTEVIPLRTARCVDRAGKPERWRSIVMAACEQSGRARLPSICDPVELAKALEIAPRPLLFGDPLADGASGLLQMDQTDRPVALTWVIGPEGGFDDAERAALIAAGGRPVWFGPRVLRAETAATLAIGLAQARWGDV
ncbi:MAG: 16S rRNA (uracil(1498)-N(3))-methyltransferase [Chromatiales bacterium]|nr:16S rRNA (uracil(1498)-N(3))-methyltransferase [Chromatiales bacterium]